MTTEPIPYPVLWKLSMVMQLYKLLFNDLKGGIAFVLLRPLY
jgi:hypothetical protein